MAIEKVVNIRINDNSSASVKNVNALATSLNKVEDASSGVSTGMKESSLSVLENGGAMGLLNDATGGLAMTVKDAVEATALFAKQSKISTAIQAAYATVVGASTGAMKIFRLALVGTGIGAIVVGLGLLIANFDKVKKVVLNLVPGLAAVGDMVMGIVNAVTDFVGATSEADREAERVKNNALKRSEELDKRLKEDGSRYSESAKKKMAIEKQLQDDIAEGKYNEVKLRKEAAYAIDKIDKENAEKIAKTEKDKQDKLNDIAKTASEKRKADRKTALDASIEAEKNAAKIILDAQMQSAKDAISILNELKLNVETPAQKEQREYEEKKAVLEANNLSIEELTTQHLIKIADIDKADSDKKIEDAKIVSDKKLADKEEAARKEIEIDNAIQDAKRNALDTGLNILQQFAGKNKKIAMGILVIQKGLAIADVVVNASKSIAASIAATSQANALAAAASPLTAGQPFVGINTALGLKGILATKLSAATSIASIVAAGIGQASSISGGGSAGGNDGGRQSAPPQFNIVGQNSNNQLAQSIGKSQNRPIEAFVVSGNMTTAQSLDRNRIATATFNN